MQDQTASSKTQTSQTSNSTFISDNQQQVDNIDQELNNAARSTKEKIHRDPKTAKTLAATPILQDEVIDIEKELLNEIITRLDQNKMSAEEAQQLAKEFLSILPVQDQKDLLNKLYKLSQANNAAKGIYVEYSKPHEEYEKQKKLSLISQHIHQGNIESALAVAKGETNG